MTGITKHKWSDKDVRALLSNDSEILLHIADYYDDGTARASINKEDALAIARHFGLFNSDVLMGEM